MKAGRRATWFSPDGRRFVLRDHRLMAGADMFLWNDLMYAQVDHRGRCTALFNQPEHTFYSDEQRCFYVRDDATGEVWSAPFDPVCREPERFEFSVGTGDVRWEIACGGVEVVLEMTVPREDTVELWRVTVRNPSRRARRLSLYPHMPVGFLGWQYHQADFSTKHQGIVCRRFPYYANYRDYYPCVASGCSGTTRGRAAGGREAGRNVAMRADMHKVRLSVRDCYVSCVDVSQSVKRVTGLWPLRRSRLGCISTECHGRSLA